MHDRYTHDGDCPHGRPREHRTKNGAPKCPPCRRRWFYENRSTGTRPTAPQITQPALINRPT